MKKLLKIDKTKPWLDYSSLKELMFCPRSYWWKSKQNLQYGDNTALINGKAYHKAVETYHEERLKGVEFAHAVLKAIEDLAVIMKEITVEDKKRNLTVASETMATYFVRWQDEPYKTIGVELGGAIDLGKFMFVGKIDRYCDSPYGKIVIDTKTTSVVGNRWDNRVKPNLQLDGYCAMIYVLTGEIPSGVLDIIPIHEKSDKRVAPFRIGPSPRTESDLEAWTNDVQEWWRTIERYENDNEWPKNTEQCCPLYSYISCGFQTLCQMYPNANKMSSFEIPAEYRVEKWAPIKELLEEEEEVVR